LTPPCTARRSADRWCRVGSAPGLDGWIVPDPADEPQFDSRVAAVLALHSKRQFSGDGYGWALCAECRQSWPCATVRAIEMADG
jgi:hypothetical protein